jgi:hypothetical protein
MLEAAADRGFTPRCVLFDQWYARALLNNPI